MPEAIKIISIKLPISIYEDLLIQAERSKLNPNDWAVNCITSILRLSMEKSDFISYLEECQNEKNKDCPIIRMAESILEKIP